MYNPAKYQRQYFTPPSAEHRWATKEYIEKAPIWCSVDLRDGNQSLITPMSLEEKLEFFKLLVDIGFKEIEVGFPAASETEYTFLRTLIENDMIPDDVTVQVLTQSREHIIKKTFEALDGVKHAIVHLYNSTSLAQREQVFRKPKNEIIDIALEGARLFNKYAEGREEQIRFEYSPESFTGTEPEFALEICNAVLDEWKPTPDRPVIINLPVTVSLSMPHVYADQVEYMNDNLKYRDSVQISLHPHNDRGCAVADTELGVLAGADRVEGTLFGNGERTGNVDIITVAMNMYTHGVDAGLDLSDMPRICETYERVTRMQVYARSPYSGQLVFAAFSGSHQDAIAKGMRYREEKGCTQWTVPYLPIDPGDVGREYETDVIRINSQSGKGGIGYLLEHNFGYKLPRQMAGDVSWAVKCTSDHAHKELSPDEVFAVFEREFINVQEPVKMLEAHFGQPGDDTITASITVARNGIIESAKASGNGRLDAVARALRHELGIEFSNLTYSEHAHGIGSDSRAVCYVSVTFDDGKTVWGTGVHTDIITASIRALMSAINRKLGA